MNIGKAGLILALLSFSASDMPMVAFVTEIRYIPIKPFSFNVRHRFDRTIKRLLGNPFLVIMRPFALFSWSLVIYPHHNHYIRFKISPALIPLP